ncbi:MAG: PAS domain S-box protein [Ignavibacteriales bacterium]|nr:PAS domain S-box protein [Ignavibacteriales bacterium]
MLIADRSTAALTFQDIILAEENLSALRIKPSVHAAYILNENDVIFAKYQSTHSKIEKPIVFSQYTGYYFENECLFVFEPITLERKKIGSVVICASLEEFYVEQQRISLFVLALIGLTTILAFLFSSRLHRFVSIPLTHLTDTARLISKNSDYSLRARKSSNDEIGILVTAFNEMLDVINTQTKDKKQLIIDLSASKSMLNTVLDTIPQSIFWKSRDGFYLGCNKTFAESAGLLSPDEITGKTAYDIAWTRDKFEEHRANDQEVIATGKPKYHIIRPLIRADGVSRWMDITKIPLLDSDGEIVLILGILEDITDRRMAEEKIINANRVYAVISQINQAIVHIRDREELLTESCRVAVEFGKFQMAWIGLVDSATRFVKPFTFAGIEDGYLSLMKPIYIGGPPEGGDPTGSAIRNGLHYVCNDIQNDPTMVPWRDEALSRSYRSSIAIPLKMSGKVVGTFNLYARIPDFFTEEEVYLLTEVTSNISFALEANETEEKRKTAVEALRKDEAFLSAIFRTMEEGVIACDANGILTHFNHASQVLHGLPHEFIPSDQWAEHYSLFYPDGKTPMHPADIPLLRALKGELVHDVEMMIFPKNGIARTVVTSGQNLKDLQGNIIGAVVTLHDITDRKKVEEALGQSEGRYKLLLDSITDYIYTVDIENGIPVKTTHQPGCIHVTGYSPSDYYADSRLWINIVHPDDQALVEHYADPLCNGEGILPIEHRIIDKNGAIRWIRNTYVLKHDAAGKVSGYDGLISDITERKIAEEELKLYRDHLEILVKQRTAELELEKEHAESADRLKSAFLATMSHELRTPLNSIIGFTGILMQERPGPLNTEQKKQLGMAQNSARHLLSLINDVLDISKIEAGQFKVYFEIFFLPDVITKVVENVKPLAQKKNLAVEVHIADEVGSIKSDKLRVKQILINLLNNAIKFTEKGFVRIEVESKDHIVVIKVIDTGIGIEKEQLEQLFRPFIQIDTGLTRKHEGTGLGLSICKKLLFLLDGKIEVESEYGAGSTFIVTLPVAKD